MICNVCGSWYSGFPCPVCKENKKRQELRQAETRALQKADTSIELLTKILDTLEQINRKLKG